MKKIACLLVWLTMTIPLTPSYAQNPPLKVAVTRFAPPFVMQSTVKDYYGFDIAMMQYICTAIQRDCQFIQMPFEDLIPAVETNKVDVAVSSITITADRAQQISFSSPYLPSESRFLLSAQLAAVPFSLTLLDNKKIGVQTGSIFATQIQILNVKKPKIVPYDDEEEMIAALSDGKIDAILMDSAAAIYWQGRSSYVLKAIDMKLPYGYGFGIAVNKNAASLLQSINQALAVYQTSGAFKKNFNMYLQEF